MDKERYKQLLINARLPENAGERLIKLVCDDYNTTENDIQFQYKRVDYFYLKRPVRDLLNLQCSGTIKAKKLTRIPGMREPGGLPSMGSHRVRHD